MKFSYKNNGKSSKTFMKLILSVTFSMIFLLAIEYIVKTAEETSSHFVYIIWITMGILFYETLTGLENRIILSSMEESSNSSSILDKE